MNTPLCFESLDAAVTALLARIEGPLKVGAPLGLGKPHRLLNALYARMEANPSRTLSLYTALSLDPPRGRSLLEKRFLNGIGVPTARYEAVDSDADIAHGLSIFGGNGINAFHQGADIGYFAEGQILPRDLIGT